MKDQVKRVWQLHTNTNLSFVIFEVVIFLPPPDAEDTFLHSLPHLPQSLQLTLYVHKCIFFTIWHMYTQRVHSLAGETKECTHQHFMELHTLITHLVLFSIAAQGIFTSLCSFSVRASSISLSLAFSKSYSEHVEYCVNHWTPLFTGHQRIIELLYLVHVKHTPGTVWISHSALKGLGPFCHSKCTCAIVYVHFVMWWIVRL